MEVTVYGTCDYWTFRRGWKRIRSKHWAKTGISIYRWWVIQRDEKLQIRTLPELIGFVYYLITEELTQSTVNSWLNRSQRYVTNPDSQFMTHLVAICLSGNKPVVWLVLLSRIWTMKLESKNGFNLSNSFPVGELTNCFSFM